ncbi:hypothetical protein ACIPM5_22950 [Streptomyces microflavus]|uniref:hypothetical protein n=3 Tax=Streptomyces microflavus TaxID=1919 RepID=UPI003815060B
MVEMESGGRFIAGTTARLLASQYVQRPSGIFVPERIASPLAPIDLMRTYVTHEELTGEESNFSAIITILKSLNVFQVLAFTSTWLARYYTPGVDHDALDRKYVEENFQGTQQIQALSFVSDGRAFVAPQLLHITAKMAVIYSHEGSNDPSAVEYIPLLPLGLGDHMDQSSEIPEDENIVVDPGGLPGVLARHLISNQHLNRPLDSASLMGSFSRRWREIPRENPHRALGSFEDLYKRKVGIDLDDLESVVIAAWCHVMQHNNVYIPADYFRSCGIAPENAQKVLSHLSCSTDSMRSHLAVDIAELNGGMEWSIAPFERFPMLKLGDGVLVLDPRLLMHRAFGWLPYFDVLEGLGGDKKGSGQLRDYAGHVSEIYALEILHSIAPSLNRSIFYENDLREAYGARQKVVDAVIDYGDRWVIVDVSTRQLMRESVAGTSSATVKKDLESLVRAKAEQIQSTIDSIRNDESPLTGSSRRANIFYPVIVASEGFPFNPVVSSMIEDMLRGEGLLQDPGIAPVQIVDISELEIVEGVQESGGPSFVEILEGKRSAGLWRAGIREYILVELGLTPKRSKRLDKLWTGLFNRVIEKVRPV